MSRSGSCVGSRAAGLYVCEMVTTRALVERNPKTLQMIAFAPTSEPAQPPALRRGPGGHRGRPCGWSSTEDLADHIDLNFGCPVPKVTRKGGGAALPWRRRLFGAGSCAAAVAAPRRPACR